MIREAVEYLLSAGVKIADPVIKLPNEPPHIYGIRKPDGTVELMTAAPPLAAHKAFTLQAVVDKVADGNHPEAEIWYGPEAIVGRFGKCNGANVTLALVHSEPYQKLALWKSRPSIAQPDLIRELRTTFRNCMERAGPLAESIRRVKFQAGQIIDTETGHGKSSVGKSIMGEVTGSAAIPEYVVFVLPVFANPCFQSVRASVECAIDPDPATGSFRVIPLPGQMELAVEASMAEIGEQLKRMLGGGDPGSDRPSVAVYYGKP